MNSARRPLIAGNWKMNLGGPGACELAAEVAAGLRGLDGVDVVICPPFTALAAVAAEIDETGVGLGAQNMHSRTAGAYTGEVSAPMLLACGVTWVIVGHSERRSLFGESDQDVVHKTQAALEAGLTPIVCVGETLAERQEGRTDRVIGAQMHAVLDTVASGEGRVVIAYEPIWAIGTGLNATPDQAQEVHRALRAMLAERGSVLADRTRLLYGGSVRGDNARDLLAEPDVDGALVGGASLDARSFLAIVQAARGLGRARCPLFRGYLAHAERSADHPAHHCLAVPDRRGAAPAGQGRRDGRSRRGGGPAGLWRRRRG